MKTSQLVAAGAFLIGYVQACTRIRVDQCRDQDDSTKKYTTITAFDDNRAPIGVTNFRSKIDQSDNDMKETWLFREPTGQVDVFLAYPDGPFAEKIGGQVAFPWGKNYASGGNTMDLEQQHETTYYDEKGVEHHVYCLWDNYNCGGYYCGV